MEPAILGVLALMLTVMLYLDRSRRNDIRDLRQEMNAGFAALRHEMTTQFTALREAMNAGFTRADARTDALREETTAQIVALREDMNAGFARTDARIDQLTATVVNLAESLGQVKGRTETLIATE